LQSAYRTGALWCKINETKPGWWFLLLYFFANLAEKKIAAPGKKQQQKKNRCDAASHSFGVI
jgi:hypothetical protein